MRQAEIGEIRINRWELGSNLRHADDTTIVQSHKRRLKD